MENERREREVIPISIDDLVEIELQEDDDFLKIRETLTRIGIASRKDRTLYQSCTSYINVENIT